MQDRNELGRQATEWMRAHPNAEVSEIIIKQSSDEAFHCVTVAVVYYEPPHDKEQRIPIIAEVPSAPRTERKR